MTLFKGSRYEAVPPFEPDPEGRVAFRGLQPRPIGPAEPVLEHTVGLKQRLDSLSQHYYRDPRIWFRLAEANTPVLFPEDLLWLDPIHAAAANNPDVVAKLRHAKVTKLDNFAPGWSDRLDVAFDRADVPVADRRRFKQDVELFSQENGRERLGDVIVVPRREEPRR